MTTPFFDQLAERINRLVRDRVEQQQTRQQFVENAPPEVQIIIRSQAEGQGLSVADYLNLRPVNPDSLSDPAVIRDLVLANQGFTGEVRETPRVINAPTAERAFNEVKERILTRVPSADEAIVDELLREHFLNPETHVIGDLPILDAAPSELLRQVVDVINQQERVIRAFPSAPTRGQRFAAVLRGALDAGAITQPQFDRIQGAMTGQATALDPESFRPGPLTQEALDIIGHFNAVNPETGLSNMDAIVEESVQRFPTQIFLREAVRRVAESEPEESVEAGDSLFPRQVDGQAELASQERQRQIAQLLASGKDADFNNAVDMLMLDAGLVPDSLQILDPDERAAHGNAKRQFKELLSDVISRQRAAAPNAALLEFTPELVSQAQDALASGLFQNLGSLAFSEIERLKVSNFSKARAEALNTIQSMGLPRDAFTEARVDDIARRFQESGTTQGHEAFIQQNAPMFVREKANQEFMEAGDSQRQAAIRREFNIPELAPGAEGSPGRAERTRPISRAGEQRARQRGLALPEFSQLAFQNVQQAQVEELDRLLMERIAEDPAFDLNAPAQFFVSEEAGEDARIVERPSPRELLFQEAQASGRPEFAPALALDVTRGPEFSRPGLAAPPQIPEFAPVRRRPGLDIRFPDPQGLREFVNTQAGDDLEFGGFLTNRLREIAPEFTQHARREQAASNRSSPLGRSGINQPVRFEFLEFAEPRVQQFRQEFEQTPVFRQQQERQQEEETQRRRRRLRSNRTEFRPVF